MVVATAPALVVTSPVKAGIAAAATDPKPRAVPDTRSTCPSVPVISATLPVVLALRPTTDKPELCRNFASVTALAAIVVALPELVTSPVRFAFVVTVAALPVMLPVAVPMLGVVKTGELAKTKAPLPVSSEITPASSAEVVAANN